MAGVWVSETAAQQRGMGIGNEGAMDGEDEDHGDGKGKNKGKAKATNSKDTLSPPTTPKPSPYPTSQSTFSTSTHVLPPGLRTPDTEDHKRIWSEAYAYDSGAKAERVASLDVLGASALTGEGVRELVDWLYIRVQGSRRM